ncbi:hypothetical protein [Mailhella sp.]|uniref:hypothetical protein n=1 Tax=Mailhella sp. TaxID=1981029 RepID=UPI00406354EB
MSGWLCFVFALAAVSAAALVFYVRRSASAGDRVLVAHGLILLLGLALASIGVAALKVFAL